VGLINEFGNGLLGKVLLWCPGIKRQNPGDVWLIGRVTGYRSTSGSGLCQIHGTYKIFYKILLSNNVPPHGEAFSYGDILDIESILIDSSSEFEQYLELFDGIKKEII